MDAFLPDRELADPGRVAEAGGIDDCNDVALVAELPDDGEFPAVAGQRHVAYHRGPEQFLDGRRLRRLGLDSLQCRQEQCAEARENHLAVAASTPSSAVTSRSTSSFDV